MGEEGLENVSSLSFPLSSAQEGKKGGMGGWGRWLTVEMEASSFNGNFLGFSPKIKHF